MENKTTASAERMPQVSAFGSRLWRELADGVKAAVNSRWLPWVVIGIGILLRANMYLMNRSLWLDEATQALNIVNRDFLRLLEPLDYNQVAPIGYLMIERLAVRLLGDNEFALRLFPFLSGIASLFLFYHVAKRYVQPPAVLVGLALVAFSSALIYYSQELRQYSSDVSVALVFLWLGLALYQTEIASPKVILAGLIGAVLVWFSHPAIFVLAGIGATLSLSDLIKRHWKRLSLLAISYILWVGSFMIFYIFFALNKYPYLVMINTQGGGFLPPPEASNLYLGWLAAKFIGIFENPLGFAQWGIPAFMFLVGSVWMMHRDGAKLIFLLSPLVFALLASALRGYPFGGRFLMFIVPSMMLLIAEGTAQIASWLNDRAAFLGILLTGLLILPPVISLDPTTPIIREEIRPVLGYLSQHYQKGDVIYLYYFSVYAYWYYAPKVELPTDSYVNGVASRDNWHKYEDDLKKLKGNARVWIVFSHYYRGADEERLFLHFLDNMGTQLDSFKAPGAAVYLYDLSK